MIRTALMPAILLVFSLPLAARANVNQAEWEAKWHETYAEYQAAADNELRRANRAEELRAFGSTIPKGTELEGWLGQLSFLRVVDDPALGTCVVGQVNLQGPVDGTPHAVRFVEQRSRLTPEFMAHLESLSRGELVSVSGRVIESPRRRVSRRAKVEEPEPAPEPTPELVDEEPVEETEDDSRDRGFLRILTETVSVQFRDLFGGGEEDEPEPEPLEGSPQPEQTDSPPKPKPAPLPEPEPGQLFPDLAGFGIPIHLDIEEIRPAQLAQLRQSDLAEAERLATALTQANAAAAEIGQVRRELAAHSCDDFVKAAEQSVCGSDVLLAASSISLECGDGNLDLAGAWTPADFIAESGRAGEALNNIRTRLAYGRFLPTGYRDAIGTLSGWLDAQAPDLQARAESYRTVLDCLSGGREELVREEERRSQLATQAITPPRGFRWGMSYDEAKATAKAFDSDIRGKGRECRGAKDAEKWGDDCPDGWRRVPVRDWPHILGEEMSGSAQFDQGGHLRAVYLYVFLPGDNDHKRILKLRSGLISELSSRYGDPQVPGEAAIPPKGRTSETIWTGPDGGRIRIAVEIPNLGSGKYGGYTGYQLQLWYESPAFANATNTVADEF